MQAQTYWDQIGSQKEFEDPLYIDKLTPFIGQDSKIVEYGCGYGRLLSSLQKAGYTDLTGFDFAKSMIERGKRENPHLDLTHIEKSGMIPLSDSSCDLCLMSTILTCMIDGEEQKKLIHEVQRVLKKGGALYLSDFLLCDHPRYEARYQEGYEAHGLWGIYTTDEGITVRHYTSAWIMELLQDFDIHWFEQFDFKTMNNNAARTFHCIAVTKNEHYQ